MAQLPPKVPNMSTANFPNIGYQNTFSICNTTTSNKIDDQTSWMDNFLNLSEVKQGTHRRSMSDSAAFLEAGQMSGASDGNEFDCLYDEQLMSMFTYVPPLGTEFAMPVSSSSASTDNNSLNEEKCGEKKQKNESEEAQSRCNLEPLATQQNAAAVDNKKIKRILANRQSAQRSRVRKLHYVTELERNVSSLQNEVSTLSPQVAFLDHQRSLLTAGNGQLKQRIAALAQDNIFKDAHQEALKKEIERLSQIYQQQALKKMDSSISA